MVFFGAPFWFLSCVCFLRCPLFPLLAGRECGTPFRGSLKETGVLDGYQVIPILIQVHSGIPLFPATWKAEGCPCQETKRDGSYGVIPNILATPEL